MIMCNACSPATLDRYADGIRQLLLRRPTAWGLVCVADEPVRGERWARMLEDAKEDPHFDHEDPMPWNLIIRDSVFRIGEGLLQGFWDQHVLHPAGLSQEAARQYITHIEGHTVPIQASRGGGGKGKLGKDVVPFVPMHPSPHTDRSGGPQPGNSPAHGKATHGLPPT